ncbi:PKD domain-containing protein [Thermodesulfatator autotrophicus]|uniref:PKD domain-containing protein n=1 Tax=Thermodesulfatator autotrophicus TaxID=1795632 RepID=A0A177EBH0_9BACT|nr:PKD domain-containing protein [Thermodesulfatator autotrophicus]OAG28349.1 hypothetical protein TH606_01870 [Thermodesulfatator autotrophicus]
MKLDAEGNPEWQRLYEGPQVDRAYDVNQTRDGGYVIVGKTNSFSSSHEDHILVIKTDAGGNILWQKGFSAGQYKHACAYSVQETADGGYVVAGKVQSSPGGLSDLLIMKLSQTGAIQWQHLYSKRLESSYSYDPTEEAAYAVQQTRDGGYIVAGYTQFFGAGGVWRHHIWVLKLDENGYPEWSQEFGGYFSWDEAQAVRQTADGGYVIAATHQVSDDTHRDTWIIRLDADGGLVWSRTYGGSGDDGAYAVQETLEGGFIVAGYTDSFGPSADLWLLKLSSSGEIVWQRAYGSENQGDYGYDVVALSNGGYVVAGHTSGDNADFWVFKLDQEGRIPSCPLGKDTEAQTFAGGGGIPLQTTKWAQPVSPAETNLTVIEPEIDVNEQCFYEPPNQPPVIDSFTVDPTEGVAPLEVSFTCQAHDPDGSVVAYEVDFGDGSELATSTNGTFSHTYENPGTYNATCTAYDEAEGSTTSDPVTVSVNEAATPTWQDITEMVTTNRSRTLYDRIHRAFFVLIDVENTSGEDLSGPIRMVIEDPTIPVKTIEGVGLTPDGVTEDGNPYFIIVPEGESLSAGELLEDLRVNFELQRRRLDFGIRIEQLVVSPGGQTPM